MKKIIKISLLLIGILASMIFFNSVKAASASIYASSTKVTKGSSVTISGSVNAGAWNLTLSGSGQSKGLVGQTSTTSNASSSTSLTFKPTKAGSYTFYLRGDITDYYTDATSNVSKSITITVTEPTSNSGGSSSSGTSNNKPSGGNSSSSGGSTSNKNNTTNTSQEEKEKSKDSTLSALTVKEGTITPEFNKDVKEYSLTIPYETSEVNVTATPTDSKATVAVEGNKNLKEGENTVTVKVTAEDGSASNYVIKVTRKRVPVALKSLMIRYENQEGELIELPLNPVFNFDKLEYTLEDLEYWIEKLSLEAIPNIEGATVDIQGADNLQTGENTITITVKIKAEDAKDVKEGEEPKEETIIYTIKVNKKEEPTLMAKISNWFNDACNNASLWFNQNTEKVILGALGVCVVALIGLSVYIIVDHNRYKDVIAKAKMERKANKLNTNNTSENIIEEIHKDSNDTKKDNMDNNKNDKPKGGKHF